MLALPRPMLGASGHQQTMFEDRVSRSAAWAACAVRVPDERFATERAESLDNISDRCLGLVAHSKISLRTQHALSCYAERRRSSPIWHQLSPLGLGASSRVSES